MTYNTQLDDLMRLQGMYSSRQGIEREVRRQVLALVGDFTAEVLAALTSPINNAIGEGVLNAALIHDMTREAVGRHAFGLNDPSKQYRRFFRGDDPTPALSKAEVGEALAAATNDLLANLMLIEVGELDETPRPLPEPGMRARDRKRVAPTWNGAPQ